MSYFNDSNINEIDERDDDGNTPFIIAIINARNDSIDFIKYFIDMKHKFGKQINFFKIFGII